MRNYIKITLLFHLLLVTSITSAASLNGVQLIDLSGKPIPNAVIEMSATPTLEIRTQSEYLMDQVNFEFVPEVLIIPSNAYVRFPNSDDSRHHVYSFSETKQFELKLFSGNQAPPVQFDKTGAVAVGCNIHDRMNGYIYITDSPIAVKSDANGMAAIPDYKEASTNEIQVWHPLLMRPQRFNLANLNIDSSNNTVITLPIALPEVQEESSDAINSLKSRLKSYKNDGD
ncbi:hypothetical protein KO489_11185 [Reinekea forsetii]|nr:hypothetical protein [Reinekea forsetii]